MVWTLDSKADFKGPENDITRYRTRATDEANNLYLRLSISGFPSLSSSINKQPWWAYPSQPSCRTSAYDGYDLNTLKNRSGPRVSLVERVICWATNSSTCRPRKKQCKATEPSVAFDSAAGSPRI